MISKIIRIIFVLSFSCVTLAASEIEPRHSLLESDYSSSTRSTSKKSRGPLHFLKTMTMMYLALVQPDKLLVANNSGKIVTPELNYPPSLGNLDCSISGLKSLSSYGNYVSHASKVKVADTSCHIKGIFKPCIDDGLGDCRYEIAAYRVDSLLKLGVVPQTVQKNAALSNENIQAGSLQVYIEGASHPQLRGAELKRAIPPEIKLLDVIIGNGDRHRENILVKDGHYFAIDNNKAFHRFDKPKGQVEKALKTVADHIDESVVSRDIFVRLLDTRFDTFHDALDELVDEKLIRQSWNRVQAYINIIGARYYPDLLPLSYEDTYGGAILNSLKDGAIKSILPLASASEADAKQSQSGQGVYIVELDEGLKGIFKYDTPHGVGTFKREIAAYKLARLLGSNLVPPTVERTISIEGISRTGSLQYFVPNMHVSYPNKIHYRNFNHPQDAKFFDFLIGQFKRHNGNIIFSQDQSTYYLIDNANNFHKSAQNKKLHDKIKQDPQYFFPRDLALLENLKLIPDSIIKLELNGHISAINITKLLERKRLILRNLAE